MKRGKPVGSSCAKAKVGRLRKIVVRMLHPCVAIVALAPFAIVAMMTWVFVCGNEEHPLAYAFYALSTYLLVVMCVWLFSGKRRQVISSAVRRNSLAGQLLDDVDFRRKSTISVGVCIDALWACGNLVMGVLTPSVWFITLGCYYLLFGIIRGLLLTQLRKDGDSVPAKDLRIVRTCGFILLASTFVLSGIVTLLMKGEYTPNYGEIGTISLATFTFYSLVSSIVGFVRLRHHENPLVVMNCRANLAISLVSLFTLEIAMLTAFGGSEDAQFSFVMPIITGSCIAVVLCAMGAVTVRSVNKLLSNSRIKQE